MGEEPGDHRDSGQLGEFGRLETHAEFDPAFCPVVAVADVGDKAKEEKDGGESVSDPREAVEVMVVDHRGKATEEETDTEPDDLTFKEKHGVSVAFGGKGRGARHHDQAEGDQGEDRADEKVDAGAMRFHERELVDLFLKHQGFAGEKFFGIEAFVEFGQGFDGQSVGFGDTGRGVPGFDHIGFGGIFCGGSRGFFCLGVVLLGIGDDWLGGGLHRRKGQDLAGAENSTLFEAIGGEQILGFYAVGLGNFRGIVASFDGVLFGADCGRFGGGVGQVGGTIWALGWGGGGVGERGNFCGASGGRLCGG